MITKAVCNFRMPPKAGKEKKKAKIGKKGKKGKKQPRSDINSEVGFIVMILSICANK